jgi:DNA (cytosine-5)-methyltransferase 1
MGRKPGLKAVDFFCCAGGVTCGFRQAGIKVLGGIDIDGVYKETYEKNNRGAKFIQRDIAHLTPAELARKLKLRRNMDNLIFVGCSPCQYYTSMQTDKSKSAKGKLLLDEFKRFVEYFSPGYVFIENVQGIETRKESPLSKFKEFLKEQGYTMDDTVVNTADYKVPQNRRRYILVATRIAPKIFVPKRARGKMKTVKDAIGKLPSVPANHREKRQRKHWTAHLQEINLRRLRHTSHDGGTRLEWKDNEELQLECYKGKDETFWNVYGRLYWDQPSSTITTKFHSISNGRFGHPDQDRALSIREGANLQSFPRSYRFYSDSIETAARMIGNAVPPELSKRVGAALLKNYKTNASVQSKSKGD